MKKINHIIQFLIIKFLFIIFKIIGYKASSNLGYFIGIIFGSLFRSKKSIIQNLRKANINQKIDLNKIATNVLGNYGRIFAEYVHLEDFRNDKLKNYISIDGLNHLTSIKQRKKKVVFVSGHFSNFELMAMQIEKVGIDLAAIYRPLNNIYLNRTMEEIRVDQICKKQIKKGRAGTREILKHLLKGTSIAIMIDQRVREGERVLFFNNLASTTTIPAQLVKKYDCDVVPIYIERKKKYFFKMYVSKPIKINRNKNIQDITLTLNKILEKMIVKNIEQWIWTHDRWKS